MPVPFQLSPGVNITERDLTLIVPQVATTPGGMVGIFQWGPCRETVLIRNEKELAEVFGAPLNDSDYARYFFVAANFLQYGNNLRVVREIANAEDNSTLDKTASCAGGGIENSYTGAGIHNQKSYLKNAASLTAKGPWCAKYPGALGNSLKVVVLDNTSENNANANSSDSNDYYDYLKNFDRIPGTSPWAKSITGSDSTYDEVHVLVIDEDGAWTGVKGTVLEKFAFLSKATNAKNEDGTSNYYKNVVNNKSKYIWWLADPITGSGAAGASGISNQNWSTELKQSTRFKVLPGENEQSLSGGTNSAITIEDETENGTLDNLLAEAYEEFFGDPDTVDVALLIAGPMGTAAAQKVIDTAEERKDCVAFVSPNAIASSPSAPFELDIFDLDDALEFRAALGSSSYGFMDSGYKLQYDKYNDAYRYVPLCGDTAGCCVRTDETADPWYSPAGFDRGRIKNVVRLGYNPGKTDRDELYKKGVNPVVTFDGQGTILFGDKTLLTRPSAFDRINVRRLFIVLEKSIATASKFLLFDFNDEFTRAQFKQLVEPYLREVQGRRGIQDFRVVCDESNNTPEVIDSNGFVGDIYIKPNRSINFIQLNFIATPTGISFEEIGA